MVVSNVMYAQGCVKCGKGREDFAMYVAFKMEK